MSELNEDILNYEIGDVDDTDITGADEDELLLSDDESFSCRISQEQEEDLLSDIRPEKQDETDDKTLQCNSDVTQQPIDELLTNQIDLNQSHQRSVENNPSVSSNCDLVSSTNRNNENDYSSQLKTNENQCDSDKHDDTVAYESNNKHLSQTQDSGDNKSESTIVTSQESTEENILDNGHRSHSDDYDVDDGDDVRERRNPKLCSEREMPQPLEDSNKSNKNFPQQFQRNRHPRGPPPRMFAGMAGNNDNFNPSFMLQYRGPGGPRRPMAPGPPPSEFLRSHNISMMRPPGPGPHRMPMHGMPPHSNRLPGPHQRMQRPMFQTPPMFNPGMPPQGMIRQRIPAPNAHPMMQQGPPFGQFPPQQAPPNVRLPMAPNASLPPRTQGISATTISSQPQQPLPLPIIGGARKVLLNPNFKGGVQAATNQLMLDTMKNSQMLEDSREAELLRQQEAFINQNRMHIEKRRRSREYSPETHHRDRDRSRSFSPPRRRERDGRKPYSNFRDNRMRRPNSKDRDNFDPKRRRSDGDGTATDKNNPKTEEDEETKAYRLEIEKQKAMREKILRDKEMRRRKAAEDIKKEEDKKITETEPLQKLTPIIVTEKKIISLKKKASEASDDAAQKSKAIVLLRKTTNVAGSDVSKTSQKSMALRTSKTNKKMHINDDDDDDIDEDELLADSPPSTPSAAPNKIGLKTGETSTVPASMFTNRRIVVRNAADTSNNENLSDKPSVGTGKGIFDRLDKKVISVNETAKRKIQRIVINNSD